MKFYADFHIHSHYSRATSKLLNLEHLQYWAQLKGLQVVGTGDFVHPGWLDELKEKLEPAEEGFFRLKKEYANSGPAPVPEKCRGEVRFMLVVEISNIYKKADKVRKNHNVVFVPSFRAADLLQQRLDAIGNIRSDGRPILGLDARDLLEMVLETDPLSFLVPAHIWTPWFSVLGSKSGFDQIEGCFGDLTKHIFAVETGLSSDPPMNWRLTQLDPFVLISNSDAHSPSKLAREFNIFETNFDYPSIYQSLKNKKNKGFKGTAEFFPEEGKYHYDGHRACQVRLTPEETIKQKGLCPVCGKPVTVGVMSRVEALADRSRGEKSARWRPYHSLIPLPEIISEAKGVGPNSKTVQNIYHQMLLKLGQEVYILMDAPINNIEKVAGDLVAEGIRRVRTGDVNIAAGYDGEYGKIQLINQEDRKARAGQLSLF
ncbi:MAG: endonuclease Q family protein [Candidatus Omnitrophica bacterium]|nr:endonuclease Q family protein [Candidatus Omnitrophota bacterium]